MFGGGAMGTGLFLESIIMKPTIRASVCFSILASLVGCANVRSTLDATNWQSDQELYDKVDRQSAYPAVSRSIFEKLDLSSLIDPSASPADLDYVFARFRDRSSTDPASQRLRDSVQDRILAVSTSRCNAFKVYLRRQQTDTNYLLGSLTTVSGALGALLQGATASRNLAGAAGIFSGLQAEYNQTYYSNLTAQVIVQGIDLRIGRLQKELLAHRQNKDVSVYTLESAVRDAIFVDGNCSVVAGLIEAQESIRQVENPGLAAFIQTLKSAKVIERVTKADITSEADWSRVSELIKIAGIGVPSMLVSSVGSAKTNPLDEMTSLLNALRGSRFEAVQALISDISTHNKSLTAGKQSKLPEPSLQSALEVVTQPLQDQIEALLTSCKTKVDGDATNWSKTKTQLDLLSLSDPARSAAVAQFDQANATLNAANSLLARQVKVVNEAFGLVRSDAKQALIGMSDLSTQSATSLVAALAKLATAELQALKRMTCSAN